jgi:hypothetical protein
MNLVKDLKKLCSPALVYLVLSAISFVLMALQNLLSGEKNKYCVGMFSCKIPNLLLVFLVKVIYIAFWTIVLNSLCVSGYKELSWFLVLLPFILFFILIGLLLISQGISISK